MKTIRGIILAVGIAFSPCLLHAQTAMSGSFNNDAAPVQSSQPDSIVQLTAESQGLTAVAPDSQPRVGTYWVVTSGGFIIPWPCPPISIGPDEPTYCISGNIFLVDATDGKVAVNPRFMGLQRENINATSGLEFLASEVVNLIQQVQTQAASTGLASPMTRMSMMASSLASSYAYGNQVYLTNLSASITGDGSLVSSFGIGGGTNFVPYDILMSTNLSIPITNWNWLGVGYTSNNYAFTEQPASLAFYGLAKPSKTMTVGIGDDSVGQCDVPFGLTNALQMAAGRGQSLALKTDGTVVAWGANFYGQGVVPTNLPSVAMISAGYYHNVALLTNGTVLAWGWNYLDAGETNVPAHLTNVVVIAAGAMHTLALCSNGTVVAWGYNETGETNVPARLTNVTAIAAGGGHSLAVSNGVVIGWGDNAFGQCQAPAGLSNVVDVAAGPFHSLALLQNGTVVTWGCDVDGETNVPVGLSNVVAIAAGGDFIDYAAYSMALQNDGTVVVWGDDAPAAFVGLTHSIGIAAGSYHALVVRTGPPTPVITVAPTDQYQLTNGSVTFTTRGAGIYGVTYQWKTNNVNIPNATNTTLTVGNLPVTQFNAYDVVVTGNGGMGSIISSNGYIYLVSSPVITSQTVDSESFSTNLFVLYNSNVVLSVSADAPGEFDGFPPSYQWQLNGTNILYETSSNYAFTALNSGTYSVTVSNAVGYTIAAWQVTVVYPGEVAPCGSDSYGQLNASSQLTNIISLAAGKAHGVVALDSGAVANWGSYWTGTNFVVVNAPPSLTNAFAVAAGSRHDLALRTDGTVVSWGMDDFGQTNVPANATNITAIAAGGQQSLALLQNGTVLQWGQTNAPIPAGLTNVTAIAAGTNFSLSLLQNSTVVGWGADDYGQINIPTGLSNVVAIAAGGSHALALEQNGTVVAWGAWTNIPADLTNAMNVAAGENHSIALKNDGTLTAWGDNTFGQTNVLSGLTGMKLIAGGGDFTLAVQFLKTVMYPVNVSQDLLLIYNTNSLASRTVENYYLQNRPMVSNANVLGIGCTTNETFLPAEYTNVFAAHVQNWLAAYPTKRPQYVVLFYDIPSRVSISNEFATYPDCNCLNDWPRLPSVQYQLSFDCLAGWNPFVTSINMGGINDCIAYINKLSCIGTNCSPGQLVISASSGGYANTNYYFDDAEGYPGWPFALQALQGVTSNGVALSAIDYQPASSYVPITHGTNVAGYLTWGANGVWDAYGQPATYYTNIFFNGSSGWFLIETIESYNGQRYQGGQGDFLQWYSALAFGGTNYSNTPVGAVSHTDEPGVLGVENSQTYFGLWAGGKTFAICAWNAIKTGYFQAVGDPFVTR